MKILHLCGNYIGNTFFSKWFDLMADDGFEQMVFVPYMRKCNNKKNYIENENISFKYKRIKTTLDRILYFEKINKYFKIAEKERCFDNVDIMHCHMLFTDGGVAYKANKKYGLPYITAVRDTDINIFMKYFLHVRVYAKKILFNAEKIIFISPSYVNKLRNYLSDEEFCEIENKIEVIPNGLSNYWIDESKKYNKDSDDKIRLIQVGKIEKRKNQKITIKALLKLINFGINAELTIVGDGKDIEKCKKLVNRKNLNEKIHFTGKIMDRKLLKKLYSENDIFVLPSLRETFGMVYIEAISQNLPIIYSKNEGVDGYFEKYPVGKSVDPKSADSVMQAIKIIAEDRTFYSNNCIKNINKFRISEILEKYYDLYIMIDEKSQ